MAAIDQSEFQGVITLLESRGMIGIKKAKETRMNKVNIWFLSDINMMSLSLLGLSGVDSNFSARNTDGTSAFEIRSPLK